MVRQAHSYLAGAVSGTALVAAAVVAFVMLVSLQALRDWPLAGLGGGDSAAVSPSQPVVPAGAGSGPAAADTQGAAGQAKGATAQGGGIARNGQRDGAAGVLASPPPSAGSPTGEQPAPGSTGGGSGGSVPSGSASPSSKGGAGAGTGALPGTGAGGGSTSGAVTGAVDDTVSGVDETLGGVLGDSGVTKVTESTVNGLAGPESTVGKTVDKVVGTAGGVLGGGR